MASTRMMHIRVDEETKVQATQTLAELGLSVSDAVRIFLRRVIIEQGMPISLKIPNEKTRAALKSAENIKDLRFENVEDLIGDIEKNIDAKKGENTLKK